MISQAELVETFFGYWPEFADANVELFTWVRDQHIELELHYIDCSLGKDAVVGLRFTGVKNVELTDFFSQNVVDCLSITPGESTRVELNACYGLGGSFTCTGVQVTRVVPNNSSKPTPLRGAA